MRYTRPKQPEHAWEITPSNEPEPRPCFCVGPQNGEPLCPCAMRARRDSRTDDWLDGFKAGVEAERRAKKEPK